MIHFVSIEPTVLLKNKDDRVVQLAEVVIAGSCEPVQADVVAKVGASQNISDIGVVGQQQGTHQIYVPDIEKATEIEFVLMVGDKVCDSRRVKWKKQRRWEVYMVPITHHDLGYTDSIYNLMNRYDGFYDDILEFCEETEGWPEELSYKYTVEAAWSIQHFVENRPKDVVEKLVKYIKQGRIEISALFGVDITNLCGHEELIRLMYPSFELKRKYGAKISCAAVTDIPEFVPLIVGG